MVHFQKNNLKTKFFKNALKWCQIKNKYLWVFGLEIVSDSKKDPQEIFLNEKSENFKFFRKMFIFLTRLGYSVTILGYKVTPLGCTVTQFGYSLSY